MVIPSKRSLGCIVLWLNKIKEVGVFIDTLEVVWVNS
jgi:hypothetical protein